MITTHIEYLKERGTYASVGSSGSGWIKYERFSVLRIPVFNLSLPIDSEVRKAMRESRALVASYTRLPDEVHPANGYLYVSEDQDYSLNKLAPPAQRNIRRGGRELDVRRIDHATLMEHGWKAFADTRSRVGLSDGTLDGFRHRFEQISPNYIFLAAWRDATLAAFLSIIRFDDTAEIEGCFSQNDMLGFRPNDTLIYAALQQLLVEEKLRLVSYGLSSIQIDSNTEGLHTFKTKLGFTAIPIHRQFVLHPVVQWLFNRYTISLLDWLLRLFPQQRQLRKAYGIIDLVINPAKRSHQTQHQSIT